MSLRMRDILAHTHLVNTVVKFAVVVMECAAQALYPP